jgi:ubiquitin-protein ligase
MSAQASFRIMKELKEFQDRPDTNLFVLLQIPPSLLSLAVPLTAFLFHLTLSSICYYHHDSSSKVHYDEQNVMRLNALLIGPEDTPYEYGLFEFLLVFPNGIRTCSLAFFPPFVKMEWY